MIAGFSKSSVIALSRVRKIETSVIPTHLLFCTLLGTRGNSFTKLWHVHTITIKELRRWENLTENHSIYVGHMSLKILFIWDGYVPESEILRNSLYNDALPTKNLCFIIDSSFLFSIYDSIVIATSASRDASIIYVHYLAKFCSTLAELLATKYSATCVDTSGLITLYS